MKLSLMFFSSGEGASAALSYDKIRAIARFADREGLERIWLPERHFVRFGALHPNPALLGAVLAAETSRVRIAAGSVVAPLHDPIRIAEEWAVVDALSRGRVDLAFASGWRVEDFALAPEAYEQRREVLRQRVGEVRALWRGEPLERRIGSGGTARISTFPRPAQPDFPLWITAARSAETFELAATLGGNVLTYLADFGIEELARHIALYQSARARAGFAGLGSVTVMLHTHLGADSEQVRVRAGAAYRRYLVDNRSLIRRPAAGEGLSLADAEALAAAQFDRIFEQLSLVGSVERCQPTVETLRAIGVNEIACLIDFIDDFDAVIDALPYLLQLRSRLSPSSSPEVAAAEPETAPLVRADAAGFYSYIESIGGSYGPRFRWIHQIEANEGRAVITLLVPETAEPAELRPILIDAAVSTAHAIGMTPGLRASSRPLGLPIGFGRVEVAEPSPGTYTVETVRRKGDATSACFDIEVVSADGRRAVSLRQVRFQRVAARPSDPRPALTRPLLHEPVWRLRDHCTAALSSLPLLVAAADPADEIAMANALRAEGARVWAESLPSSGNSGPPPEAVPVLLAHTSTEWRFGDVAGPRSAVALVGAGIQRWMAAPGRSRIFVFVRGANRVLADDPSPDPNAAAAWAAACSLAASLGRRPVTVVDLDPGRPLAEAVAAAAALLSQEGDGGALAIRGTQVYTQEIVAAGDPGATAPGGPPVRPGASALITGGTGALGRSLAAWLADEGVGRLWLVARHASRASAFTTWLGQQIPVETVDADLSRADQVLRAVTTPHAAAGDAGSNGDRADRRLDLLFHLAGDVVKAEGAGLDEETIDRSFRPKLDGLLNLYTALAAPPERLVLFASVAGLTGSSGQAAYAAANAAMVAAAQRLPGVERVDLRVLWLGPWGERGMAGGTGLQEFLKAKGVVPMSPWMALHALGLVLSSNRKTALIAARVAVSMSPREARVEEPTVQSAVKPALLPARAALQAMPPEQRPALLESQIIREVAEIMEIDASAISPTRSVYDSGFDSLMALELKNAVLRDYGITFSLAEVMKAGTIREITEALLPLLLAEPEDGGQALSDGAAGLPGGAPPDAGSDGYQELIL